MDYSQEQYNQRQSDRFKSDLPIKIIIGTQISIQGYLKDISLKSAYIKIKHSVFISTGDEIGFIIEAASKAEKDQVEGQACVSRLIPGEGLVIYFTKLNSEANLKKFLQTLTGD